MVSRRSYFIFKDFFILRDNANNLHFKPAIAPIAARTDNTPIVSSILDTLGFGSATLALVTGTNTDADATFVTLLEESNDSGMSGATAVADIDLIGTEVLPASSSQTTLSAGSWATSGRSDISAQPSHRRERSGQYLHCGNVGAGPPGSAPTAQPAALIRGKQQRARIARVIRPRPV